MDAEALPAAKPRARRVLGVLFVVALLLTLDLCRAPSRQWSARVLIGAIHVYQGTLSPLFPTMGVNCKFHPSCSRYAEGAIRADGALVGTARALGRLARCGPWTPRGTVDPP